MKITLSALKKFDACPDALVWFREMFGASADVLEAWAKIPDEDWRVWTLGSLSPRIAKLLIEGGADVNAKDKDDSTSLHWAAAWGHTGIVALLIAHGADVNAKNKGGEMPLHRATNNGYLEIVNLLNRHGAK